MIASTPVLLSGLALHFQKELPPNICAHLSRESYSQGQPMSDPLVYRKSKN